MRNFRALSVAILVAISGVAHGTDAVEVKTDWNKPVITSKTTATLQVVVNPAVARGGKLHDASFKALKELGADYVRYVPWLPYPRAAVAELDPPTAKGTSWDFRHIDPTMDDFMKATEGHPVVINYDVMPAWLWQHDKPIDLPKDPDQVFWTYTQGTTIKDPSYQQAADYYVRLLQWYTKGGFTDENGKYHKSGHHYRIAWWELLNEIEAEHAWTPEEYTRFYDVVTAAMRKVQPDLKFVAIAASAPRQDTHMFSYFLDPKNHAPGTPLDGISYHFYAGPDRGEPIEAMQYTFFNQADGFIAATRYIEDTKQRLSPRTLTFLNELGAILPTDGDSNNGAKDVPDPPAAYWNLAGALYAYLYAQTAALGVDVAGESQLVGYPTQFPAVSMMDYHTAEPNARFWVLKLIKDNFGPGDKLATTTIDGTDVFAQGFDTPKGHKLLLVNKRITPRTVKLEQGGSVEFVAPSTGNHAPMRSSANGEVVLEPFEVAVVTTSP